MRSRNREINIFNLSMLDVIAGAMGAFLIVMVVLMPFYKKQAPATPTPPMVTVETAQALQSALDNATAAAAQAQTEAQAARTQAANAQAEAQAAREQAAAAQTALAEQQVQNAAMQQDLKKTFVLVHIHWPGEGVDIDLHVIDPRGNEFYWEHRTTSGATGNLSLDSIQGPGNEVFIDNKAQPGDYKVMLVFYGIHQNKQETQVDGSVVYRDGTIRLPSLAMNIGQIKQPLHMATIRVNPEGQIRLVPP
jgi:hypothetical protein